LKIQSIPLLALALSAGCARSAPSEPAPAATRAQIPSPAKIAARAIHVSESLESAADHARVTIRFSNSGDQSARVVRYRLRWSGGEMLGTPSDQIVVPAHADRERTVRVTKDFESLLANQASLEVEVIETAR
jgi:hypothetical protein